MMWQNAACGASSGEMTLAFFAKRSSSRCMAWRAEMRSRSWVAFSFGHGGDLAAGSFAPVPEGEGFPDRLQHRLRSRLGLRDSVYRSRPPRPRGHRGEAAANCRGRLRHRKRSARDQEQLTPTPDNRRSALRCRAPNDTPDQRSRAQWRQHRADLGCSLTTTPFLSSTPVP